MNHSSLCSSVTQTICHSGLFRERSLGHGALWQKKFFFHLKKNLENIVWPTSLCEHCGQQKFGPLFEILNTLLICHNLNLFFKFLFFSTQFLYQVVPIDPQETRVIVGYKTRVMLFIRHFKFISLFALQLSL